MLRCQVEEQDGAEYIFPPGRLLTRDRRRRAAELVYAGIRRTRSRLRARELRIFKTYYLCHLPICLPKPGVECVRSHAN